MTFQFTEISGNQGAPWLSRYLSLHHSDRFDVTASDYESAISTESVSGRQLLDCAVVTWPAVMRAETQSCCIWQKDNPNLYEAAREQFEEGKHLVARPASILGLEPSEFKRGRSFPSLLNTHLADPLDTNILILPTTYPTLEREIFKLHYLPDLDISDLPSHLGAFDFIFGRHLGIGKQTLLTGADALSKHLTPDGEMMLNTDVYGFMHRIVCRGGSISHDLPERM